MDVREYSENVRDVVRKVGRGGYARPKGDMPRGDKPSHNGHFQQAISSGLVYWAEPVGYYSYFLTDRGRDLLRQMERDDKAAAQASKTVEFEAIGGYSGRLEGQYLSVPPGIDVRGRYFHVTLEPPKPPPEPPSWDDAPAWATSLACNPDGTWRWYEYQPELIGGWRWYHPNGKVTMACHGTPNPNWRDSLQERPAPDCIEFRDGYSIYLDDDGMLGINPAPLCPVCGKPAGEHCWGLWCCPFCGGEWRLYGDSAFFEAHCRGCGHRTKGYKTARDLAADVNRRAR